LLFIITTLQEKLSLNPFLFQSVTRLIDLIEKNSLIQYLKFIFIVFPSKHFNLSYRCFKVVTMQKVCEVFRIQAVEEKKSLEEKLYNFISNGEVDARLESIGADTVCLMALVFSHCNLW